MRRARIGPCNGPIPISTIQAQPKNLFRSGLGVGMSSQVKKGPVMVYRPGVGYQQVQCTSVCTALRITLDGGSPWASGLKIIDGNGRALFVDGGKP